MTDLSKSNQQRFWDLWKKSGATLPNIWEQEERGEIRIKKVEATPTPLWRNGWYKNPSSGRSHNYGIGTGIPKKHRTVIIKGGSFFVDQKFKDMFIEHSLSLNELYGGMSFESAQKEMQIASLIQGTFKSLLGKNANCPQPLDVKIIGSITDETGNALHLLDYFKNVARAEQIKKSFTVMNFLQTAPKVGIDIYYPMSKDADPKIAKYPFDWVFAQCLEKTKQSVYWYTIDGPNTRLLDLMTQGLSERRKYFVEANNASDIGNAVELFSAKLGEFYGVLHKSNIGYHEGSSEHCTLMDITVSGVIMDIGGLSENSCSRYSEEYAVEMWKATNLIAYLCKNILKTSDAILKGGLHSFWGAYKSLYSDENVEYSSKEEHMDLTPSPIRTKYFDNTVGGWINIAPDLQEQELCLTD